MSFAAKWMKLESIMFSKISQIQKDKFYIFSVGGMQKKKDSINIKMRLAINEYREQIK